MGFVDCSQSIYESSRQCYTKNIVNIYDTLTSIVTLTCTFWQLTTFNQKHLACTYYKIQ